jgi:hypothetical protein
MGSGTGLIVRLSITKTPRDVAPAPWYEWLRYHDSNKQLAGKELAPYLVEAMAVLPYFCGAKGIVLWGWAARGSIIGTSPCSPRAWAA